MAKLVFLLHMQNYVRWLVAERSDILRYWTGPPRFLFQPNKFGKKIFGLILKKFEQD